LWDTSDITASARIDAEWKDNHTATLRVSASSFLPVNSTAPNETSQEKISLALYNGSTLEASRIALFAKDTLWVGEDAQIRADDKIVDGFCTSADCSDPSCPGIGGGHGGYGAKCYHAGPTAKKRTARQEAYGVLFGGADQCLDGNPGATDIMGNGAGFGGGQILIHADNVALNGASPLPL
jgi:hypothetical protein